MDYKFRLMYCVPDSDRYPITSKATGKPMEFNSVEEAMAFRSKNDLSDVDEDAFYWLIPEKYFHPEDDGKPKLSLCYIELAE